MAGLWGINVGQSLKSLLPGGLKAGIYKYSSPNAMYFPRGVLGATTTAQPMQQNQNAGGVQAAANKAYNDQSKLIDANYKAGLLSFDQAQNDLAEARSNIQNQMAMLRRSYGKSLKQLGDTRDQTIESQRGYFNFLSPEAYQSQQGVYENKAHQVYKEGVSDLNYTRQQNERAMAQAARKITENERSLAAQREVFNADAELGGKPNIASNYQPSFKNYDTSAYINSLAQMALANMLTGAQPNYAPYQQKFDTEGNPIDEEDINSYIYQNPDMSY